ncbi:MAG: helix-turn-helix domain-containing protein [Pseudomonadota bacterium]
MARVLIIEDETIVARDLEQILRSNDHEVVGIAKNAIAAIDLAEQHAPDVALVDIQLKGDRDGVTLAYHLRDILDLKIIFVTSHADPQTMRRVSAVKPNGYILKPFNARSVFATLEIALADDRTAPEAVDVSSLSKASVAWSALPKSTLDMIETHIRKNFNREITLKELAGLAGMSESTFSRRFKASTSLSPYQFILNERIVEAKRLLRDTNWSLADIAIAVGFSSQSHFATAFKKIAGLTPLAYRRLG